MLTVEKAMAQGPDQRADLASAVIRAANLSGRRLLHLVTKHFGMPRENGGSTQDLAQMLVGLFGTMNAQRGAMRSILMNDEYGLVYQPIVRLRDRTLHHHEALLRVSSPAGFTVRDTQGFVDLIETLHLSEALDIAVSGRVLRMLGATPDAVIAVNMSGHSLQSATFRDALLRRMSAPDRFIVEVTETAEISDLPAAAETLRALRRVGVRVCLDDFGAGYASMRYLRELPVDFVKIDGSYVRGAMACVPERELLRAMCDMARAVGAATIAEKIEHEHQAALMEELGVTFGQGWLLGHPLHYPA